MQKGTLWNGKYYELPQASSAIDSSGLANTSLGSNNIVVMLAEMDGLLTPQVANPISNPAQLRQLIDPGSYESILGGSLLFDPSPSSQGASQVFIVPVNKATPSTVTLKDAAAGNSIVLTSYLFGLPANQLMAKVEAGTVAGTKITVQFNTFTEIYDNLYKQEFSVQYLASGTCTMTIDPVAGTFATTASVGANSLALSMATYPTIQALVNAINANPNYTATIITNQPTDQSSNLDGVTAQDIKTAVYTLTANLQAAVDGINSQSSYVSAAQATGAKLPPAVATWQYLTGGTDGSPTNNDWQTCFDLLKTMQANFIVSLASDPSIWAMADAHCRYMSGPDGNSPRRSFVGGALQSWISVGARATALANLCTQAQNLNSDRTVHAGLGIKQYDLSGNTVLFPGYITACAYAGIAGGSTPVMPLTRKYLNCLGLEVLLQPAEIAQLIEAGVAPPIADTVTGAGYVVSRQVTTWDQSDDLYRVEFSVGRGCDYIAQQVRNAHALIVGQPGDATTDISIVNATNAILDAALAQGYINSYDPTKTQLRVDGMTVYVDYFAVPVLPVSWIFSTYHLEPTTFSIGLSNQA